MLNPGTWSGIFYFCIQMRTILLLLICISGSAKPFYKCQGGKVRFTSVQTLETIKAVNSQLRGIIDAENGQFHFVVPMAQFEGFNSPLQKEHFNENYIETHRHPDASFRGHIIESLTWETPAKLSVRAKGDFTVHGLTKDMLLLVDVQIISAVEIRIHCKFQLSLNDFGIKIPRMVHKKLAELIEVEVDCSLIKSKT